MRSTPFGLAIEQALVGHSWSLVEPNLALPLVEQLVGHLGALRVKLTLDCLKSTHVVASHRSELGDTAHLHCITFVRSLPDQLNLGPACNIGCTWEIHRLLRLYIEVILADRNADALALKILLVHHVRNIRLVNLTVFFVDTHLLKWLHSVFTCLKLHLMAHPGISACIVVIETHFVIVAAPVNVLEVVIVVQVVVLVARLHGGVQIIRCLYASDGALFRLLVDHSSFSVKL